MFGYEGLDGVDAADAASTFDPPPQTLSGRQARYRSLARAAASRSRYCRHRLRAGRRAPPPAATHEHALAALRPSSAMPPARAAAIHATSDDLDEWLHRSIADLQMMITETPTGPIPTPGCPGSARRSAATGSSPRWRSSGSRPSSRAACSAILAATQATEPSTRARRRAGQDPARGARRRDGGARRGAVRPLLRQRRRHAALRDARRRRTCGGPAIVAFVRTLWPHVDRALRLDRRRRRLRRRRVRRVRAPDRQGARPAGLEGLARLRVPRRRHAGRGADRAVRGAGIRLRGAFRGAAEIAAVLGHAGARRGASCARRRCCARVRRGVLGRGAGDLRAGARRHKRPCRVRSSNAGHALWTGIAEPAQRAPRRRDADERAGASRAGASGRSTPSELRYNPMSYHNGSVWPHDNALIAAGLRALRLRRSGRCGCSRRCWAPARPSTSTGCPSCSAGFRAGPGEGPTLYPVACAPQAWAAGAVFMLLGAALGIDHRRRARRGVALPPGAAAAPSATCASPASRSASGRVDLLLENHPHDVGLTVLRREGEVRVVVVK